MTLIDAFRSLGCLTGDAEMDAARQTAAALVLPELQRLVRGLGFPIDLTDDAVAVAFCNLMTGGNRSNNALACDSDARVRAFLKECLRNALLDELRKTKRIDQLDPVLVGSSLESQDASPEEAAMARQEVEMRRLAEEELYARILPALSASIRPAAGRDLTQAIEHMRAMAAGEKDFGTVVVEAVGKNDESAQSAVHQRHSRARRRLVEFIEHLEAAGEISQDRARALRWCVSRLQRRAS